eukprot:728290_1
MAMITSKLDSQKDCFALLYNFTDPHTHNSKSWGYLCQFLFHLYWTCCTDFAQKTQLFNSNMLTMDIMQQLLNGTYGPPKRVIALIQCILQPIAHLFLDNIIQSIHKTSKDLSKRYQYLLWYNLINCICFGGTAQNQPSLVTNVSHFKFESQFIRMIQIDVNISEVTGVKRSQPLEKEALWILTSALRRSHDQNNKYSCFEKMCCVLSVYSSTEYSYILEKYKQEICIILKNQKRPLRAAIALYSMLEPKNDADTIALINVISEFVKFYVPTTTENTLHRLRSLLEENTLFARHTMLLQSILANTSICYKEYLIEHLVPILQRKDDVEKLRQIYHLFWQHYGLRKTLYLLVDIYKLPIHVLIEVIKWNKDRISKISFDEWLDVIVHKQIKDDIKLLMADHVPCTYDKILDGKSGAVIVIDDADILKLDLLEQTLLTANPDEFQGTHKPLMYHYKKVVCHAILQNFLNVETKYFNCHDEDINSIKMLYYFYKGYGMRCVKYCHRLSQHDGGSKLTFCKTLMNNFMRWWQNVREAIVTGKSDYKVNETLIGGMYHTINSLYHEIGGPIDTNLDIKVDIVFNKYQTFKTNLRNRECTLYDVHRHFQYKTSHIEARTIEDRLAMMKLYPVDDTEKLQQMQNDIMEALTSIQCLYRCKAFREAIEVFHHALIKSNRFDRLKQSRDTKYEILDTHDMFEPQDVSKNHQILKMSSKSNITLKACLRIWAKIKHEWTHDIKNMNCNKAATEWLFIIAKHASFVEELFELFEDDSKFAGYLKIAQNQEQLTLVRKTLVSDLAASISGKSKSEAMHVLLYLTGQVSDQDVMQLESLIQEWHDIRRINEFHDFLASLGFEKYLDAFGRHEFRTMDQLKEITDEYFKEMGVAIAHRIRLKNAIKTHFENKKKLNQTISLNDDDDKDDMKTEVDVTTYTKVQILVRNVLIICIAIGEYMDKEDLYDVCRDVASYRDVLSKKYQYKIMSSICMKGNPGYTMTKQDVERFVTDECLPELLGVKKGGSVLNPKIEYDGLLVAFSGHGTLYSIVCSDSKMIEYSTIREWFSKVR